MDAVDREQCKSVDVLSVTALISNVQRVPALLDYRRHSLLRNKESSSFPGNTKREVTGDELLLVPSTQQTKMKILYQTELNLPLKKLPWFKSKIDMGMGEIFQVYTTPSKNAFQVLIGSWKTRQNLGKFK